MLAAGESVHSSESRGEHPVVAGSARMATDAWCVENLACLCEVKGLKSSSRVTVRGQRGVLEMSTVTESMVRKRTQKDSGEERVTAKSKPMMNLVSRCSERTPDVLASTASESPVKTRCENQLPLSSRTEQHHRTGRPVKDAYSSSYSEWNVDKTWSSQEWKSDELMEVRTGRPVVTAQHTDRFIVENDTMNSYTEGESEMSLERRVFRNSCRRCD